MGMRRGRDSVFQIVGNELLYVALGADHTAEHEWGIKDIKRSLGIPETPDRQNAGIEARIATKLPDRMAYLSLKGSKSKKDPCPQTKALVVGVDGVDESSYLFTSWDALIFPRPWRDEPPPTHATAWCGESFGIRAVESLWPALDQLWAAMQRLDLAIWVGASGPFGGGLGLILGIPSAIPNESLQMMRDGDLDNITLKETAEATGIEARLKAAGKKWFALSPRWANDEKTKVQFWLNPMDQKRNNAGWFDVQALDQWADGKGPVVKGA